MNCPQAMRRNLVPSAWIRTCDPDLTKIVLYRLSYEGARGFHRVRLNAFQFLTLADATQISS